jgi:hypothetical protein
MAGNSIGGWNGGCTSAGYGRVNAGQGVVMTVQAPGAALSPAPGGLLARHFGYPTAFIALGAISTGSLVLWLYCGAGLRYFRRGAAPPLNTSQRRQLDLVRHARVPAVHLRLTCHVIQRRCAFGVHR